MTGFHNVELMYSKSPLDQTSIFKFFVIDAEQVQTIYNSGVPSNQILWKVSSVAACFHALSTRQLSDTASQYLGSIDGLECLNIVLHVRQTHDLHTQLLPGQDLSKMSVPIRHTILHHASRLPI